MKGGSSMKAMHPIDRWLVLNNIILAIFMTTPTKPRLLTLCFHSVIALHPQTNIILTIKPYLLIYLFLPSLPIVIFQATYLTYLFICSLDATFKILNLNV